MTGSDSSPADAYDPQAESWESYSTPAFIGLAGPFWRREMEEGMEIGFRGEAKHGNVKGGVHGGMLATLMDHAMGECVRRAIRKRPSATVQMDVQYLSAAQAGEFITAQPRIVHQTRSLVFAQVSVAARGRLIATASGIWKILNA